MSSAGPLGDAVGLLREIGRDVRATRRKAAFHSPHPPAEGLVLDVGAGHMPEPRADVVVDKYAADDFERASGLDLRKPVVVGDGHALPFADNAFAYVVASHVLEHATDVDAFAAELGRVGAAGFVQVPSAQAELTFGWPFHPWLIDLEDGVLVFRPRGDAVAPYGQLFHNAVADSALFRLWFGAHREVWHHTVHWDDTLSVRSGGTSAAAATARLDVERTVAVLQDAGVPALTPAVRAALRCPVDRRELREQAGHLACTTCERSYPVAGEVPVLLAEAAA